MGKTIDNLLGRIERIVEPWIIKALYNPYTQRENQTIWYRIKDYINYKKAQIEDWRYHHKDNYCTACGIADKKTLDAIMFISEFENRKKSKKQRRK